ncbi:MAG: hypothetical protein U1F61_01925 [Opitutaceae bacterium]
MKSISNGFQESLADKSKKSSSALLVASRLETPFESGQAVSRGVAAIHTEASRISRPFFGKQGSTWVEIERVDRFGVEFERFRMRKALERAR